MRPIPSRLETADQQDYEFAGIEYDYIQFVWKPLQHKGWQPQGGGA